ncbi:pitrilysin family protein [Persicobacter psychrovividus]|uniref:Peptidase M16 n=1 Tax=Persicobacter psychrovividus TaxID=387638 RepID=A0ABM7VKS6_9BACT|nr:peptidase M16 [Persicobacter psychrovividus]
MKRVLSLVFCCLCYFQIMAQDTQIKFEEYDLPNGLHVILHQDQSTPNVQVSVGYHVGSKNEVEHRTGFAHFFEHLLFEGSKNIKRGEFDKYCSNAGGYNNAYTTQDMTFYYDKFPAHQWKLGLWLESERMLHANILQIGVDTQRKVVKEEKRMRYARPYGTFLDQLMKHTYKVHPYAHTPIGSMEDLNQAKLEEFMNFYNHYYVPNNAVLVIAGDFNIKSVKAEINTYFKDIPKGEKEIVRPTVQEPAQTTEIRDVVYDNITLPGVFMGYRTPGVASKDYQAVQLFISVLANGASSRMYKQIVDKEQIAMASELFNLDLEYESNSIVYSIASQGVNPNDLEKSIDKVVDNAVENGITQKELDKAKNIAEAEYLKSLSKMDDISQMLAKNYIFKGNTGAINTTLNDIRSVSLDDISRVAKKYFVKDNRVVLQYLPKTQK